MVTSTAFVLYFKIFCRFLRPVNFGDCEEFTGLLFCIDVSTKNFRFLVIFGEVKFSSYRFFK